MATKFFTNKEDNALLNKFNGVFENNKDIKFFDALVGYLRSPGYFAIKQEIIIRESFARNGGINGK